MKFKKGFLITVLAVTVLSAGLLSLQLRVESQTAKSDGNRDDLPIVDHAKALEPTIDRSSLRWIRNSRYDSESHSVSVTLAESDPEELYELPLTHPEVSA